MYKVINRNEPRHEKTGFLHVRKPKTQISFAVTAKLISAFVFATRIVQSLYFLYTNFQASSHLVWLYRPVCVGPGQKTRRPVFSQRNSNGIVGHILHFYFRSISFTVKRSLFFMTHYLFNFRYLIVKFKQ